METAKILVVDDDPAMHALCQCVLDEEGYAVVSARGGLEALRRLREEVFDLVLLDYKMPHLDGIEVLRRIRQGDDPDLGVVIITGKGDMQSAIEAFRLGALDYVTKPIEDEQLLACVRQGLEVTKIKRHLRHFARERHKAFPFEGLIGESPAMQRVYETIVKVAASPLSSVLIRGETGTGKRLVARAVHDHSPRAHGPFVQVNCTAIPADLVEVELFGAEKGAFTDATERKTGYIERADGGTLFLDEVGHMPLSVQPKLLNAIEEKTFRRVGGRADLHADVRIVAATNRDLERAIDAGEFRADLYYRLNVIPIHLPPLRERGDDVLLIAQHFAHQFSREFNKPLHGFAPEAEAALLAYHWAGNVRELKNVIERAVLLSDGEVLTKDDLALPPQAQVPPVSECPSGDAPLEKDVPLEEMERHYILHVLRRTGGNKAAAARILGVSTETLRRKLKEWREE